MKALEIRPNDADLHHLLGRFKYEVANLGWIERKVYAWSWLVSEAAFQLCAIDSLLKKNSQLKENTHSEVDCTQYCN